MNATELLQKIGETIGTTATVKSVFGEPIRLDGKTVVPVAKVAYGFGGGVGSRKSGAVDRPDEGGGGGGGVRAFPAGALEITDTSTRFVPYSDFTRAAQVALALAAGFLLGAIITGRMPRTS